MAAAAPATFQWHEIGPIARMDWLAGFAAARRAELQGLVEDPPMSERATILNRIRAALKQPAPRPGEHGPAGGHSAHKLVSDGSPREWLPPSGDTFDERVERFGRASEELKTAFHFLSNSDAAVSELQRLRDVEGWKRIASHRGRLVEAAAANLGLPILITNDGYAAPDLESCDVGLTECDALVAQMGTVVVNSRAHGGRALSVLPPHHIVVATHSQLVGDLTDAIRLVKTKYSADYPSMISFITGPSRTGDIERILVLGAHGPRKLTILCVP